MNSRFRFGAYAAPLFALASAACAQAPEPTPITPPARPEPASPVPEERPAVACMTEQLWAQRGKKATPDVVSQIKAMNFGGPVRVLKPGSAATMDFVQNRINVEVDDKNVITSLSCG